MKFTDLPHEGKIQELAWVNQRWRQLYELEQSAVEQAIRYLLLTNSGGAIAVLSFLGASESVREMMAPRIALAFFAVGVVLSGVLLAFRVHEFEWLFRAYQKDATSYLDGNIERDVMVSSDGARTRARIFFVNYGIAYLSFFCFVIGGGVGLCSLIVP